MARNLTQTILKFMRDNPETRFTVGEVAQEMKTAPDEIIPNALRESFKRERKQIEDNELKEISKELFYGLRRQISALLSYQAKKDNLQRVEGEGLLKYYYTDFKKADHETKTEDEVEVEDEDDGRVESAAKDGKSEGDYTEEDMYPWLGLYLKGEDIGSKRIDHTKIFGLSSAGEDFWLFPDVVGVDILIENWEEIVVKSMEGVLESQFKFWSFEVKKEVSKKDVRKKFLQAVANSSWANFGYLVVGKIDAAEEELKMLSNHYGIGVIKIHSQKNQIDEDEEAVADTLENLGDIKFPARENKNIDWVMVNRLARRSVDFNACFGAINKFTGTRKLSKEDFKKEIKQSLPELKAFWGLEDE